ncbi:uncharacterized protein LOC110990092 [Acanthaster planci]|uniref:Uncharacterized protein LOC110990092 n=1 Tax=Acanthaster planci TaxID=133434 RepID=A0A8B7ZYJ3_ACAPL|nr:uncharacterized protein LOC110990092 [Acanthaster planci]
MQTPTKKMPLKTIKQLDEDNKATAGVYDHSNAKLITKENKVKRYRKDAFLSALPYRRALSCHRHAGNKTQASSTAPQQKCQSANRRATRRTKKKLRFCVQTHLPLVPKTLSFELDPETPIASLKGLIRRKLGVRPQHQRLYVRGNIQLCDLLTLHENGVDKDENISLSTDDATQGGLNELCQARDKAERPQPEQHEETKAEEQSKQKGEPTSEAQTQMKEAACKTDGPQALRYVKQKLQIFIRNPLPRGPKALCFQLDPEMSISALKKLIHNKIGVQLQYQCLYIRRNCRNFKLCDMLTLNDCGIQQDENILLRQSTDCLRGGGPKDKGQVDDELLRDLSSKVQDFWIELAKVLGYEDSKIKDFQTLRKNNKERSHKMLLSWWNGQENRKEGLEKLREALRAIGLSEQALLLPETCQEDTGFATSNEGERLKQDQACSLETSEPVKQEGVGIQDQNTQPQSPCEEKALGQPQAFYLERQKPNKQDEEAIEGHSKQKGVALLKEHQPPQEQVCDNDRIRVAKHHVHTPGQTQIDSVHTGQTEETQQEEMGRELPTLGQQQVTDNPSIVQGIIDLVAQLRVGTPSAISAVHSHGSLQPASVGAINVTGEHNSTIVGSTVNINLNVQESSAGRPLVRMRTDVTNTDEIDDILTEKLEDFILYQMRIYGPEVVAEKILKILDKWQQVNLHDVTRGSVTFIFRVESRVGLECLWLTYSTGELAKKLTEIFITDELTTEDKTGLAIRVTIPEKDYEQACRFFDELEKYERNGQDASNKTKMQPGQFGEDDSVTTTGSDYPAEVGAGRFEEATKASRMTIGGEKDISGAMKLPQQKQFRRSSSETTVYSGDPAEHAADKCEEVLKTLYTTTGKNKTAIHLKWSFSLGEMTKTEPFFWKTLRTIGQLVPVPYCSNLSLLDLCEWDPFTRSLTSLARFMINC